MEGAARRPRRRNRPRVEPQLFFLPPLSLLTFLLLLVSSLSPFNSRRGAGGGWRSRRVAGGGGGGGGRWGEHAEQLQTGVAGVCASPVSSFGRMGAARSTHTTAPQIPHVLSVSSSPQLLHITEFN